MKQITSIALMAAVASAVIGCQGQTQPSNPSQAGGQGQTAASAPTLQPLKQITVGKTPHGMTAANGFIYNSNQGAASISVIDPATDTVVKEIPVADGTPGYTKAFHDGKHVLTLDRKNGNLLVIDPAKDHQVIQTISVGLGPDRVLIDEDDKTVMVALTDESKLVQFTFDADRAKVPARKDLAVGSVAPAQSKHRSIDFKHGWAMSPNSGENNISLVNLSAGTTQTVMAGNSPGPVGIGTAAEQAVAALVGNAASNTISLFDLPSYEQTTLSDVGLSPTEMTFDAQLRRAYVTMAGSNDVAVIDYVGKKLIGRVPAGKRPVHIFMAPPMPSAAAYHVAADGTQALSHEIWVGNDDGGSVTVFDGDTLRVKATIMTGNGHHKMAFVGTKAYVSNLIDGTVSVVDRTAIK
jgi:YVTN family beta-propeller protein